MNKKTVKIAVYGSLKRGFYNHRIIEPAVINCQKCTITGRLFDTGSGYPAFTADTSGYPVQAELMTLDARILYVVDMLEGHPRFYRRDLLTCTLENGNQEEAFVYTMPDIMTKHMQEITSGEWK